MSASTPKAIRIATRASALALWQARHVAELIRAAEPGVSVELVHVSTTGDRDQSGALRSFGGMGVFTSEVQRVVLDGQADIAVHSLKDLPTEQAVGLCLVAVPEREETDDALLVPAGTSLPGGFKSLPPGARVGTGSLRRQAQLRHARPDLQLFEIRGNVETRVRKLDAGEFDAIVLAVAGLKRLGLDSRIVERLVPPVMYPAVGQGALGIECRVDDAGVRGVVSRLDDGPTRARVTAERTLLAELRAGCHAPVGAATTVASGNLSLEAVVLSADGTQRIENRGEAPLVAAESLGREVAQALIRDGAAALIGN